MQKARRHSAEAELRPLVSVWFQVLFTPLLGVLFTFPSQYWFAIGLLVVFSLTRVLADSHRISPVPRYSGSQLIAFRYVYRTFTFCGYPFQNILLKNAIMMLVLQPHLDESRWFGLIRFRSPLLTESLLFSLPPGT